MDPPGALLLGLFISAAAFTTTRSPPPLPTAPAPEKEGQCPRGKGRDLPPSWVYCIQDATCPGAEKCCTLGRMRICLQPPRVGLGYCPKGCLALKQPCRVSCLDDTWCHPGEKCCQEDCHLRCVGAEPARPGVCPRKRVWPGTTHPCANQCEDDRSCPPGMKCCFDGCGLGCVNPDPGETPACTEVAPRKTCPDLCTDDANCPRNMKCSSTECGLQCRAPHPETERPGRCPDASHDSADWCRDWCQRDSECPGAKKCCQVGCAKVCREPVLVKPGACPLQLRGSMGPCPDVTLQNCSNDFDCENAQKCCSIGCHEVCKEPEEVRPGSCPFRVAESTASTCLSLTFCMKDGDCAKPHEKCCRLRCGWVCLAIETDVPTKEPFRVTGETQEEPGRSGTPSPAPVQKEVEEQRGPKKAADVVSGSSTAHAVEEGAAGVGWTP
ncbi:hypothetical protein JRQ81_014456 [Phrynocephalus forsythii]|uniref:WAP domain-containing protein n=1 Tax=Phrynocephalus forsythii TaxID=171643 RepID=A0A9Q0XXP3_9SAUR|nr:hypothetical protein JRQ81_014456 [Phrynocephalus forsythii]